MIGGLWAVALAAALPPPAPPAAAAPAAWRSSHEVDPITDAVRDAAVYKAGDDAFMTVCTRQTSGAKRFWVAVETGQPLGRRGVRALTYRIDEEPATTSQWSYAPRFAAPAWPLEDRHLVQRLVEHKASRIVFRLRTYDGGAYDLSVPIDDDGRALIARTLASC